MKTLIQENGFEYSSNHRFGNPKEYLNEFQFLISFDVDLMLTDQREHIDYRITDDNYIQFCSSDENQLHHRIVAQHEINGGNLKEQVCLLLRDYIVGLLLFVGFPYQMNDSLIFNEAEFKALVKEAEKEYDRLKKDAKERNRNSKK
jgi:hypothetical protein